MDGKKKVLFYGAGEHAAMIYRHAKRKSEPYGEPAAFIDRDIYKQGHDLFGLPVISWEDAQRQYGDDFYIYVTGNEKAAPEILGFLQEQGIAPERIINWEPVEKRLDCWTIGTMWCVAPMGEDITYISCCSTLSDFQFRNVRNRVCFHHDVADRPEFVQKAAEEFRKRSAMEDSGGICKDCADYVTRYCFKSRKLRKLHFGGVGYCNFKCMYCFYNHDEYYPANTFQPYDIFGNVVLEIEKNGLIDDSTVMSVAAGEFSISDSGNQFIEAIENYPMMILTNAYIFSRQVAHALENSGIILCSVDAGTPESFRKIKGVDGFTQVSENLKKYAEHGPVSLKYILMEGINDSLEDLNGFFQLADEVAIRVSLTRDYFSDGLFSDGTLEFVARFIKHFRDEGKLNMSMAAFVRSGEGERLNKILEELEHGDR